MAQPKQNPDAVSFIAHQPSFVDIVGRNPTFRLLADATDSGRSLYHEACIYHHESRTVFVTSNQLENSELQANSSTSNKHVKLFRIWDEPSAPTGNNTIVEDVTPSSLANSMLNGGVNFGPDSILLCAQGSLNPNDPSGLISVRIDASRESTEATTTTLESFYSIPFNSVNDVIVHPEDSSIWFTDPHYGFHQSIRAQPQLPNQVYRFDPQSKSIRAVACDFTRPNGLCFSPDLKTLYVTDTGAIHGSSDIPIDPAGPSHIYAFDITYPAGSRNPFLTNRRLFAYAPGKFPDGIKCDTKGNVYSGCGDGIEVWNQEGVQLGTIAITGGVANFCFGESGTIYACNETRFWKIKLGGEGIRGALLGI